MQAKFAEERDWDQFHSPRNLLLAMVSAFFFFFPSFSYLSMQAWYKGSYPAELGLQHYHLCLQSYLSVPIYSLFKTGSMTLHN